MKRPSSMPSSSRALATAALVGILKLHSGSPSVMVGAQQVEGSCHNPNDPGCGGKGGADALLAQEEELAEAVERRAEQRQRSAPVSRKPVRVTFENKSPKFRADVHYDDGRFGRVVGTAEVSGREGSSFTIDTFKGHRFWVTRHGVREAIVDPETDAQYVFTVDHEEGDETFTLPETAAPSETKCKDRYPICADEAARGECTNNPGWMIVNCCEACDEKEGFGYLLDSNVRCTPERLNSTVAAWKPGSLNELFTSWATEEKFRRFDPHVISAPNKVHNAWFDGPWIMMFDNFLSDHEISQILKGATFGDGFQRSTDQGSIVSDSGEMVKVKSTSRTSANAWCRPKCEALPGVRSVTKRIEALTGIPEANYESLQILKYEEGQFYRRHHDSSGKNTRVAGHRILTFFLYMNDVDEGGQTAFTDLNKPHGIKVIPAKGRALVWSSVLDEDPNKSDMRMYHEAMKVVKGTKYAANHWIHQYDFRTANKWGCNGSFG